MLRYRFWSFILGATLVLSSLAFGQGREERKPPTQAPAPAPAPAPKDVDDERPCSFTIDVPGGGTTKAEALCPNHYGTGKVWVITGVGCWSSTGQVSILPQLTGQGPSSIIPEPLQCGNRTEAGRETPGTPTLSQEAPRERAWPPGHRMPVRAAAQSSSS